MRLTNGNDTFLLEGVTSDNLGPVHGMDPHGCGYSRCDVGACDNHTNSPHDDEAPVVFWHDDEHTETLWEVA